MSYLASHCVNDCCNFQANAFLSIRISMFCPQESLDCHAGDLRFIKPTAEYLGSNCIFFLVRCFHLKRHIHEINPPSCFVIDALR